MRAFLPITQTNLAQASFVPLSPYLILEDANTVLAYTPGWPTSIPRSRLEEVTPEDIRAALLLPEQETIYLSEIRELPTDDMFAPELLKWLREWWIVTVAELRNQRNAVPGKAERVA